MKEIPLTRGKVAIVDDADYEELSKFKWHFTSSGYACRFLSRKIPGSHAVYMHRQVAKTLEHEFTDHINSDRLDNRRCNLRTCNSAENTRNRKVMKTNKLGIKGVSPWRGKFRACLMSGGVIKLDKSFVTIQEAKSAYDQASKLHHGEFSRS